MKTKSSVFILSAIFSFFYFSQMAVAQITFVRTPTQQRPQGQGQSGQPGLSPEKKKSLSKYGPEDAFPGAREQENNQRRSNRAAPRQATATPQPSPTPTITPSTVTVISPASPPPSPMATVTASIEVNKSQTGKSGSSVLVPASLSAATLLVFGALIYVVGMLRKKLKQEN